MNRDCLKLTTYLGERDRIDGALLADALMDVYERRAVQTSVLLRGTEGFGLSHRLQTQRLLSLSEDLPLISVAVDERERILATVDEVVSISGSGLVTLERARMLSDGTAATSLAENPDDAIKLTIYCARRDRIQGRAAHVAIVEMLHREGMAGATVLLGVDGTVGGSRQRARFFARNAAVPLMIISVGDGSQAARMLPWLQGALAEPRITLERVRLCKRDGRRLAAPPSLPDADRHGRRMWQKLVIYASEQVTHEGNPLYVSLTRRLREEGAAGATSLRGMWGYHGDHRPHGDAFWSARRRVPVVTAVVDTPERVRRWYAVVDELTQEAGLVTSEMVPAFRAATAGATEGDLRLAQEPW